MKNKAVKKNGVSASQQIDDLIAKLGDWRGELLARLRKVILAAAPELTEEWKWGTAVWTSNGLVCSAGAFKDHVKLNFFNFAALPITFGIGVDYAINVVQRYRADGSRDIRAALRTTGGAVVLCSLTTILGYLALLGSHNRAIRSLGVIAVVGEISCLLAAVTVLPALWLLIERRANRTN